MKRRPKAAKTKKSDMIKQFNDGWEFAKEGGEYAPVELARRAAARRDDHGKEICVLP